jgi:hypothetical protein
MFLIFKELIDIFSLCPKSSFINNESKLFFNFLTVKGGNHMSKQKRLFPLAIVVMLFMSSTLFANPMINQYWNDFSGGMGDALTFFNPTKMYILDDQNGSIHISKSADDVGDYFRTAKLCTQMPISGNFDIRVDFQLIESLQDGGQLELQALGESFYFFVVRSNEAGLGGQNVHVYYGMDEGSIAPNPCIAFNADSGTLRITREGEMLTAYAKSESTNDYQTIFSYSFPISDVYFKLAIQSQPLCHGAQSVKLDNFRIMTDNILILENESRMFMVSDGIQPYNALSHDPSTANGSFTNESPELLDISAFQVGSTSLTVTDSSGQSNQTFVQVLHSGRVSGRVSDDKNQPLANISVQIDSLFRNETMITQVEGFFNFEMLYPGPFEMKILPPAEDGFLPQTRNLFLQEGEQINLNDIHLEKGTRVTGSLKKPDNTSFAQAILYIQGLEREYATQTNDNGDFTLCLPEGDWYLDLASTDDYGLFPLKINVQGQEIIELGNISTYAHIDENRISGKVFGSNITPWDYLQVVAFPADITINPETIDHISPFAVGYLNRDNNYELFSQAGASVQLFLVSSMDEPGVESSVTILEHHPEISSPKMNESFSFKIKGFSIQSKILWHNQPAENCGAILINTQTGNMVAFTQSDKNGDVFFYHVQPSEYEIWVENDLFSGKSSLFSVDENVDVPNVNVLSKVRRYLYDDFSGYQFNSNKWELPETGHSIENNQASLYLSGNTASEIQLVIPGNYPYISTLVQISNDSHASENASALAIIGGKFYNDTHSPETPSENLTVEGNIIAEIQFSTHTFSGLQARAVISREMNANERNEIVSYPLNSFINYDHQYEASILFTEEEVLFQLKEVQSQQISSYRYTIETNAYPPVAPVLYLANQIRVEPNGEGSMHAFFDDVHLADLPYQIEYISGTIFGADNTGVANIHGQIFADSCRNSFVANFQSGENGQYMVPVSPGTYYIVLDSTPYSDNQYVEQWWMENGGVFDCMDASPVVVEPENPAQNINFTLIQGVLLSGLVTSDTGTPLKDVCIHAKYDPCDGPPVGNAQTLENGMYEMIIPAGSYFIQANTGCSDQNSVWMDQFWNQKNICHEANMLQVNIDQHHIDNINFSLESGFQLHGRIVDSDHEPLEQLRVGIWHESARQWRETKTDEQGNFTLSGIPEGVCFINIEADFMNRRSGYQDRVIISGPKEIEFPEIVIQNGYIVTGKFVRPDNTPVSDIELECFANQNYIDLETDDSGVFSQILSTGHWTIILDEDDIDVSLIPVTFTVNDTDLDLGNIYVYTHSATNRISGVVDISFEPEGNLEVVLFPSTTDFSPENFDMIHPLNFSEPNDLGEFQLHVPTDIESMVVLISMIDEDENDAEQGTILQIINNLHSPQSDVSLQAYNEGYTLNGCVNLYNDVVKGNESILLYRIVNNNPLFTGFSEMPPDGCFQLFNVPPGTYQLVINVPDYQVSKQTDMFNIPESTSLPPIMIYGMEMLKGDLNGDGCVNLSDVIIGLRLAAKMDVQQHIFFKADVNNDGVIGICESIDVLKRIADSL